MGRVMGTARALADLLRALAGVRPPEAVEVTQAARGEMKAAAALEARVALHATRWRYGPATVAGRLIAKDRVARDLVVQAEQETWAAATAEVAERASEAHRVGYRDGVRDEHRHKARRRGLLP